MLGRQTGLIVNRLFQLKSISWIPIISQRDCSDDADDDNDKDVDDDDDDDDSIHKSGILSRGWLVNG